LTGLLLDLAAIVTDYIGFEGTLVEDGGFLVGTLLGLLLLTVGSILAGISWPRPPGAPRLGAWLVLLAIPGMVLLGILGFGNLPSMPVAWFCLAWLALGGYLVRSPALVRSPGCAQTHDGDDISWCIRAH